MEKISVIVPCYQVAPFIENFFRAMSRQTFSDKKFYFVYDKSTDSTLDEIKKNIVLHPELICEILYSPVKRGLGAARDFAIDSGKLEGKYLITLDPDDTAHPNLLEKLFDNAENTNSDLVFCGFRRVDSETGKTIAVDMIHNPPCLFVSPHLSSVLVYSNPATWNKLIRLSVIHDCRYIHAGGSGEDAMFYAKLVPFCKKITFINEVLIDYSIRKDSFSSGVSEFSLQEGMIGFAEAKQFYEMHPLTHSDYIDFLTALAVLRVGIGPTTRCCINNPKRKRIICKETKAYLSKTFPNWRKCPYLSFRRSFHYGKKALLVWNAKQMMSLGVFPLFVSFYKFFVRTFRKDIKW